MYLDFFSLKSGFSYGTMLSYRISHRHIENNEIELLMSYDKGDFPPDLENLHG